MESKTLIPRSTKEQQKVIRLKAGTRFREDSEVQAAYNLIGSSPRRDTKSWYRDIYERYQNNEC